MSTRQQTGEVDKTEEQMDPSSTSTQLKRSCGPEKVAPRKKVKATKTSVDLIMLTEGDLLDIREMIRKVMKVELQELRME